MFYKYPPVVDEVGYTIQVKDPAKVQIGYSFSVLPENICLEFFFFLWEK